MNKYDDFYGGGSDSYHKRLFLWFIAFLVTLFFFNEREGGLFVANAHEHVTITDYHTLQVSLGENSMNDLDVSTAEE